MTEWAHFHDRLILTPGTQVVVVREVREPGGQVHPGGSVGVIVASPEDLDHFYRVRFADGGEASLRPDEVVLLAKFTEGEIGDAGGILARSDLFERVIFRCIIGSRAYGLDTERSDIDYRGIYLPRAEQHWSIQGVPDQIESEATQEQYWELQRFIVLALKANPNVLECLYTPLIEKATPLADELLAIRSAFLSRLVYQTYNGYVLSQFKKLQADLRNQGQVKWKHVMHLLRLLISGIHVLRHGEIAVRVDERREELLAVRRADVPWEEIEKWRISLHAEFDRAYSETKLPDRPDYERANSLLVKARRLAVSEALP